MHKGNLLIVDDDKDILKLLRTFLLDHTDGIDIAPNGIEALDILKNKEIHCIICDIDMPQLNGIELIKKIREFNVEIPIIFFSAFANKVIQQEVADYGTFDFVAKPCIEDLLVAAQAGLATGVKRFEELTNQKHSKALVDEYKKKLE